MRVFAADDWLVSAREMSCAITIARSPMAEISKGCKSNSAVAERRSMEEKSVAKDVPVLALDCLKLSEPILQGVRLCPAARRA